MSKQIGVKCPECGNDDRERFGVIGISKTRQEIYIYENGAFEESGYVYHAPSVVVRGSTGDVLVTCRLCGHDFYTSKVRPMDEMQEG